MWNYSDFLNCVIDLQDNGRCFLLVHCYFYILYGPCEFSISQMYVYLDCVFNFLLCFPFGDVVSNT